MSLACFADQAMKAPIFFVLLLMAVSMSHAQEVPPGAANAQAMGQGDSAKLSAFKKKLTDGIDMRIGKLEELQQCTQEPTHLPQVLQAQEQNHDQPTKPPLTKQPTTNM